MSQSIQTIAVIVSLPFSFGFKFIGVFVNSCYTGFTLGWKQTWINKGEEDE